MLTDLYHSKQSKVQSHNLAPAILEGLMPIASEEEPEAIDDDARSRVCAPQILEHRIKFLIKFTSLRSVCAPYHRWTCDIASTAQVFPAL